MGGFLDPFSADGTSFVSGGLSRPSRRHSRSRSRVSHKHKKKRSRSKSRSRSSSRDKAHGFGSIFGGGGDSHYHKHNSSKTSFFNLGNNHSRSGFFGFSKPSYYKRSSRHGFLHRSYKQLKRLLRDLIHWAKRHPWKVFFLVIMPLVSGGVLTALLARFGLRMPRSLERLVGIASKAVTGDMGGVARETVRMAGDFGGSRSSATVHVRDRQQGYERSYRGSANDGWGGAVAGMAKMFI